MLRSIAVTLVALIALLGAQPSSAERPSSPPVALQTLAADPIDLPAGLEAQLAAAQSTCDCFSSSTAWEVIPAGSAAQVFSSPDIFYTLLDLDAQLPWAGYGQINAGALPNLLGSQAGVLSSVSQFADPSGHGYKLGAYKWSYMTAPDYCSSETLYLQYFEHTGVLFAWRFDSSSEC